MLKRNSEKSGLEKFSKNFPENFASDLLKIFLPDFFKKIFTGFFSITRPLPISLIYIPESGPISSSSRQSGPLDPHTSLEPHRLHTAEDRPKNGL